MIRAKDDPAAQTVTQVDDSSTADETDNIWESCPECQDENIILSEIAQVADDPNPDKHGACPKEDAADVITCEYLSLDLYLENGANDGQYVINNDEDIPTIHKLKLV